VRNVFKNKLWIFFSFITLSLSSGDRFSTFLKNDYVSDFTLRHAATGILKIESYALMT